MHKQVNVHNAQAAAELGRAAKELGVAALHTLEAITPRRFWHRRNIRIEDMCVQQLDSVSDLMRSAMRAIDGSNEDPDATVLAPVHQQIRGE